MAAYDGSTLAGLRLAAHISLSRFLTELKRAAFQRPELWGKDLNLATF